MREFVVGELSFGRIVLGPLLESNEYWVVVTDIATKPVTTVPNHRHQGSTSLPTGHGCACLPGCPSCSRTRRSCDGGGRYEPAKGDVVLLLVLLHFYINRLRDCLEEGSSNSRLLLTYYVSTNYTGNYSEI